METIFGGLLEFSTEKELETFLETINDVNSLNIIETALNFGHRNGIYDIQESHIVYVCLQKLKNILYEKNVISDHDSDRGIDN